MAASLERSEAQPRDYSKVTEEEILSDIAYFNDRLGQMGNASSVYERARKHVYTVLLRHRKQLLAAYRDGRPEAWPEYEAAWDEARN
jgi:hypothetical protein